MRVEPLLAKERIRKLRDKGFLGTAGKGNAAGVTPIRKTTDPALYSLNTALDGDKDGDACES